MVMKYESDMFLTSFTVWYLYHSHRNMTSAHLFLTDFRCLNIVRIHPFRPRRHYPLPSDTNTDPSHSSYCPKYMSSSGSASIRLSERDEVPEHRIK